jgi:hypothetical protein
MSVVPSGTARRLSGDGGSALVEAGLLSPVLLFIFLAVIEYGYFFASYLAVGRAAADGARVASVLGNDPATDYEIVQSIEQAMGPFDDIRVEKIIVYKAANYQDNTPPLACQPATNVQVAPLGANCNGYSGSSSFSEPKARFGCVSPNNLSQGYCPTNRKVAFQAPGGPPDYVGIYIRYRHGFITGLFGDEHMIEETVITRVEPSEVS